MEGKYNKKLVLQDGTEFLGVGFGADKEAICELVFNTSPVGYQEIVSDPSYTFQAVVMTYPLIGNYGVCDEDYETRVPSISGLVVRDYNGKPSNFRYTKTLDEIMVEYGIVGISEVDTRCITRKLRNEGSQKSIITSVDTPTAEALKRLEQPLPRNAVSCVSTRKKWFSRTAHAKYEVVAVDCGIKLNIVRCLNARGCNVTVVPFNTSAEEIEAMSPDGVFFSNGPGDPSDVPETAKLLAAIRGKYPVFGICLGHQLAGIAYGAKTFKLKFGHRGGNHPVKNLETGKLEITSQNHSFAIDRESLNGTGLEVTHLNILDGTVEGMECKRDKLFTVQYHPESAPGPQDSGYLFDKFVRLMAENK